MLKRVPSVLVRQETEALTDAAYLAAFQTERSGWVMFENIMQGLLERQAFFLATSCDRNIVTKEDDAIRRGD